MGGLSPLQGAIGLQEGWWVGEMPSQPARRHGRVAIYSCASELASGTLSFFLAALQSTRNSLPGCVLPQVLDLGQVVAGNFCGALLAYFGADVIKASASASLIIPQCRTNWSIRERGLRPAALVWRKAQPGGHGRSRPSPRHGAPTAHRSTQRCTVAAPA